MASSFSDALLKEFNDGVELVFERQFSLDAMEDGLIKDWIFELIANDKLKDKELIALHRDRKTSGFNPFIYG